MEPRTCFSPQSRRVRKAVSVKVLPIKCCELRIIRKSEPFISCICLYQVPCLVLIQVLPSNVVFLPNEFYWGQKIQKLVHDSVADEELAADCQEGQ